MHSTKSKEKTSPPNCFLTKHLSFVSFEFSFFAFAVQLFFGWIFNNPYTWVGSNNLPLQPKEDILKIHHAPPQAKALSFTHMYTCTAVAALNGTRRLNTLGQDQCESFPT
jgi:hypothetical protein